jgi:site-specific DNA-methyltransferase (adenine-specific)
MSGAIVVQQKKRKESSTDNYTNVFFNQDCVAGAAEHLPDASVDLLISDPPYGIDGGSLHKHYNRDESNVLDGYVEVAAGDYRAFSSNWIRQAARVLKPGAMLIVVSGYSQLLPVLDALESPANGLAYHRHIVWKYNFGVWTTKKYVSSHYHILCYTKRGGSARTPALATPSIADSVWVLNREYKPGEVKNKNQLPSSLLNRLLDVGAAPDGALVADFFLGSFSTARAAIERGLNATGFEVNKEAFEHWCPVTNEKLATRGGAKKVAVTNAPPPPPAKTLVAAAAAVVIPATTAVAVMPVAAANSVAVVICWSREVPTADWLARVVAVMRPAGSLYLVVTPEQLRAALTLLQAQAGGLKEINHIVWRRTKAALSSAAASSHNHILFLEKHAGRGTARTFNAFAVFEQTTRRSDGRSANYVDREDVWWNQPKDNNEHDTTMTWIDVVRKAITYSSNAGDVIGDFSADNSVEQVVTELKRAYVV